MLLSLRYKTAIYYCTALELQQKTIMVRLHVKKGDESQFLVDSPVDTPVDDLLKVIVPIYNGRLKVHRISAGKVLLKRFGTKTL